MHAPQILPETHTYWYTIKNGLHYSHDGRMVHAIGFGVESDLLNPGCDAVQVLTEDEQVLNYDHDQRGSWPHPVRRLHQRHQGWVSYGRN